jgi:hypothetical protein
VEYVELTGRSDVEPADEDLQPQLDLSDAEGAASAPEPVEVIDEAELPEPALDGAGRWPADSGRPTGLDEPRGVDPDGDLDAPPGDATAEPGSPPAASALGDPDEAGGAERSRDRAGRQD